MIAHPTPDTDVDTRRMHDAICDLCQAYFVDLATREELRPYVNACLSAAERMPGGRPRRPAALDLDGLDRNHPAPYPRHTRSGARQ